MNQPTIKQQRRALFLTGFLQVLLVAVNTYQIAHNHYVGAVIVGFGISWCWTANVKRVAFGNKTDRFIYAAGAAVGTISGLLLTKIVYEWLGLLG
jgi:hypothetical protein